MHKPKTIQINVPRPCHEQWDAMTENASGRHCNSCQKTVIDFSTWSDAQLFAFFADGSKRNVCGRFQATQINRPIHIPYQPHSRLYRMTVALGLTLLFTQTPHLLAQTAPPRTARMSQIPDTTITWQPGTATMIHGIFTDPRNEPYINATVHLYQNNILKATAQTDYNGCYQLVPIDAGVYDLVGTDFGDTIRVKDVVITGTTPIKIDLKMKWNPAASHLVGAIVVPRHNILKRKLIILKMWLKGR
jgi:hypothetical protein